MNNQKASNQISTSVEAQPYPILYSLRNCPYAMRARIAIFKSKQTLLLRDLVLSNKPPEMLAVSPKGTVPVVVLPNASMHVIEESLDVMLWALGENDPDNLLHLPLVDDEQATNHENQHTLNDMLTVIHEFDTEFKTRLEQYKCAKRYKENNITECRAACEVYIQQLEERLARYTFLMSDKESLLDIALLPFVRQFSRVERPWYQQSSYPNVKKWLNHYLQSVMFTKVMAKYPLWVNTHENVLFGANVK